MTHTTYITPAVLQHIEAELTTAVAPILASQKRTLATLARPHIAPELISFEPNAREIEAAEAFVERHQYTTHAVRTLARVLRERWGDTESAGILESILPALAAHESEAL